jgi:hypothetical protein
MHSRAAERVDGELEAGGADCLHVDDIAQVVDVGQDEIFLVRRFSIECSGEAHSLHPGIAVPQKFVGPVLDPLGHVSISRTTVRRVVLETAVLGRVVRRGDDNAVREMLGARAVVDEDRARDDRGRCKSAVTLDDCLHPIGRQNFERCALGRPGNRVGILAHIERAIGALGAPIVAYGLGDSQDVGFGERPAQWRATMPAGTEADELLRIVEIGPALVVFAFEPGRINQHLFGGRFAGQWRNGHRRSFLSGDPFQDTGQGFAFQISVAYCAIVRSLENLPELATFKIALRAHALRSAYNAVSRWSASI